MNMKNCSATPCSRRTMPVAVVLLPMIIGLSIGAEGAVSAQGLQLENPNTEHLVARAEDWRWSSIWRRVCGSSEDRRWLSKWPLPQPRSWADLVNQPQTEAELEAIRRSVTRSQPYGDEGWVKKTAKQLGLESTLRSRGRPRKDSS